MAGEEDKVEFPFGMDVATEIKGDDWFYMASKNGVSLAAQWNKAKEFLNITSNDLEPLVGGDTEANALVVPAGPEGQTRRADVASGKWYDFGNGPVEATADKIWKAYWDGSAWFLIDMGALPVDPNAVKKNEVIGEASSNIYNYEADLTGLYINNSGDKTSQTGARIASITLEAGQTHITFKLDKDPSQPVNKYYAFYNSSDVKIAGAYGMANSNANPTASVTVAIPPAAAGGKIYFTTKNAAEVDTIRPNHMVNYGQTALPFIPFNGSLSKVGDKSLADYAKKKDVATPAMVDSKITSELALLDIPTVDNGAILSRNLADPSRILNGFVQTTANTGTTGNASWRMIWVPCNGNEDFAVGGWGGTSSGIGFFSGAYPTGPYNSTNIITSGTTGSQGITRVGDTVKFKTPAGCTWWVITIKNGTETNSVYANLMIAKGTEVLPYEPFGNIPLVEGLNGEPIATSYIKVGSSYIQSKDIALKSDINPAPKAGEFQYEYDSSKTLNLIYGSNRIIGLLGKDLGYTRNNVFDFQSFSVAGVTQSLGDEAAPVHAMNYTLGANHGGPSWLATIAGHGLSNVDIGKIFIQGANNFVLARVVSSSQLQFISQNVGTYESPAWNDLVAGSIVNGANTYTVTDSISQQIYPSIKNHTRKLFIDGVEVQAGISGKAKKIEVHESYEIKIVESIYNNLIARAGSSSDPTFDGDSFMKVDNVYRFTPGMACLVLCKYSQLIDTAFADIMGSQSMPIGPIASVQYYIPNSNPLNASVDLRKPKVIAWSNSIPGTAVNVGKSPDPANPPHRVIQYRGNVGYMTGYLKDRGVGKNITDYTNVMFELRNNTGKIYPHPVEEVKVGNPLLAGNVFSIGLYRVYTDLTKTRVGNRLSVFTVPVDDGLMVYVDYSGSMVDNIKLEDFDLSGKNIEIVESKNTVLKSDMYTNGFDVNATYVEGQTCYIIVKIK